MKKQIYNAPQIKVVAFSVEHGFGASDPDLNLKVDGATYESDDQHNDNVGTYWERTF